MNSLKPCLHCGQEEDGFEVFQYEYAGKYTWSVICRACTASVEGKTEAEARERWNRRCERPLSETLTNNPTLTAELMQLADLALANEQTERDLYIAHLQREPEAVPLIKQLQNGLCKAARIARGVLGQEKKIRGAV